jgi:hypothetical protein
MVFSLPPIRIPENIIYYRKPIYVVDNSPHVFLNTYGEVASRHGELLWHVSSDRQEKRYRLRSR